MKKSIREDTIVLNGNFTHRMVVLYKTAMLFFYVGNELVGAKRMSFQYTIRHGNISEMSINTVIAINALVLNGARIQPTTNTSSNGFYLKKRQPSPV